LVIPPDNQNIFPIPLLCILMLHNNGQQAIFVFYDLTPLLRAIAKQEWMVGQTQRVPILCER